MCGHLERRWTATIKELVLRTGHGGQLSFPPVTKAATTTDIECFRKAWACIQPAPTAHVARNNLPPPKANISPLNQPKQPKHIGVTGLISVTSAMTDAQAERRLPSIHVYPQLSSTRRGRNGDLTGTRPGNDPRSSADCPTRNAPCGGEKPMNYASTSPLPSLLVSSTP